MPERGRAAGRGAGGARGPLAARLLLLIGLAGCAHQGGDEGQAAAGVREAPAWVVRGSGAVEDGGARVFVGVGSVHGIRNPSLARTTADNRARAEIAKIFSTYSAALMRDYAAATSASGQGQPAGGAAHEEQDVQQTLKTFSAATLSGVQIVDHWTHPTEGAIYALARLDVEAFRREAEGMQELGEGLRRFVQERADAAHQALEAEAERRLGAGTDGPRP